MYQALEDVGLYPAYLGYAGFKKVVGSIVVRGLGFLVRGLLRLLACLQ